MCVWGVGGSGTKHGVPEKNHLPRGSTALPPLAGFIPAPPQRKCTALGAARERGDSLSAEGEIEGSQKNRGVIGKALGAVFTALAVELRVMDPQKGD